MAIYSIYLPSSLAFTRENIAEHSRLVPDKFSWGGFLVPLLWLLFNRLWLNALLVLVFEVGLALGASRLGLPQGVTLVTGLVLMGLVGLEGRKWLCAGLERRGFRLIDTVEAPSPDEALHRTLAQSHEAEIHTANVSTQRAAQSRGVIGLFPDPDSRS
ncbi:MAG: DUF2628 domain-containing protein [Alphaproteobacteria bacterium]